MLTKLKEKMFGKTVLNQEINQAQALQIMDQYAFQMAELDYDSCGRYVSQRNTLGKFSDHITKEYDTRYSGHVSGTYRINQKGDDLRHRIQLKMYSITTTIAGVDYPSSAFRKTTITFKTYAQETAGESLDDKVRSSAEAGDTHE